MWTVASVALLLFHLCALWSMAATFASGLVWWANILLLAGPVVTLIALIRTIRKPARPIPAIANAFAALVYIVIWAQLLPKLEWRG